MTSNLRALPTPTGRLSRRAALELAAAAIPLAAGLLRAGTAAADITDEVDDMDETTSASDSDPTKPTKHNTGVPAGIALTSHDGDITVTRDGTVIDALDIHGQVKIRAADVVVRRCRIRGIDRISWNTGLVDCNHPDVRNAVIEDCLLRPDQPSVWLTGVLGKEYTARRNNVYWTVDGFGAYNASDRKAPTNVTIRGDFIHDNGPTHNDGIQVQGGSNVVIEGNNILTFMSRIVGTLDYPARNVGQGILIQPHLAPITHSRIAKNWIDGGKVGIYFVLDEEKQMTFGECAGNRLGRNQWRFGNGSPYQIRLKKGIWFINDLTDNEWADTGRPLQEGIDGGIRYEI